MYKIFGLLSFISVVSFSMDHQVWDGAFYDKHSRPQYDAAMQHLKTIPLESWGNITDIGCGSGAITAAIADRVKDQTVVGIDVCPDMIATAEKLHGSKRKNLNFIELDAQNPCFRNAYGGAVSFLTLHWIQDKPAFFASMFKELRPGGKFFLTAGTKNGEIEALKGRFFKVLLQDPKWQFLMSTTLVTGNNAISRDELAQMAQEAGFEDVQIEEQIEKHSFASTQELANFFSTFICGYKDIAALSAEKRAEFVSTGSELWTKVCCDGKPSYTWANLVAKGKKPGTYYY